MNKMDIKNKINKLGEEKEKLAKQILKIDKEIESLMDEYFEKSPEFTKIVCLVCGGKGYIENEDGKKVICRNPSFPMLSCNGKGYIWLRKYEEK